MKAELVTLTQAVGKLALVATSPEDVMVYLARVSNPSNQANLESGPKLLRYCIKQKHWSVFETVYLGFEIETSRAIAAQLLRHNSLRFQEFSQRYAAVENTGNATQPIELRYKGDTNRQSSLEPNDSQAATHRLLTEYVGDHVSAALEVYAYLLEAGVAPESARFVLPLATTTTLYATGSVRSWIHYLDQRCDDHAQKEHRDLANLIKDQFCAHFPVLAEACGWSK